MVTGEITLSSTDACTGYLLFLNKGFSNLVASGNKHLSHDSMDQNARHSLIGCSWVKVSTEVAGKLLARAVVSSEG